MFRYEINESEKGYLQISDVRGVMNYAKERKVPPKAELLEEEEAGYGVGFEWIRDWAFWKEREENPRLGSVIPNPNNGEPAIHAVLTHGAMIAKVEAYAEAIAAATCLAREAWCDEDELRDS